MNKISKLNQERSFCINPSRGFTWEEVEELRNLLYGTNDDQGVINIPAKENSIVKIPDGYYLEWSDVEKGHILKKY